MSSMQAGAKQIIPARDLKADESFILQRFSHCVFFFEPVYQSSNR